MPVSVRRRAGAWQLASVLGFVLLGALFVETAPQLLVLPVAWFVGTSVRLRMLRCPNCGNPIYRRTVQGVRRDVDVLLANLPATPLQAVRIRSQHASRTFFRPTW